MRTINREIRRAEANIANLCQKTHIETSCSTA